MPGIGDQGIVGVCSPYAHAGLAIGPKETIGFTLCLQHEGLATMIGSPELTPTQVWQQTGAITKPYAHAGLAIEPKETIGF